MDMNPIAANQFLAGQRVLNIGKPKEAISLFTLARAENEATTAEIEQQLGICYRLTRRYKESEEAFEIALLLVKSVLHEAQILRDQGMLFLVQDSHEEALAAFRLSYTQLSSFYEEVPDNDIKVSVAIERYVSIGFIGRAQLLMGHRKAARKSFQEADVHLCGCAPYELNNLVWWMKAEPLSTRRKLTRRAWKLARQDSNIKRQVQIILLAACPTSLSRFIG